jgi:organic radical activating enzyme
MRTAILYIAERCNQHCVFCLEVDRSWAPFVDPSTREVFSEIDRLRGRGANHITFMGGETFFRKDLPRILVHAKAAGFTRVGVTTNGTVLSKKGFIKDLVDSGLDFIEFSVHGHTPELTTQIVRTGVSYERQASALDEINELGGPFTIVNVVVCQENKNHLVDIARYVCDKLPRVRKRFKFKFVQMMGLAAKNAEDGESLRFEDVDPTAVGDYLESRGVPFWLHTFPLCRLGRHKAHSHELGVMGSNETYFDYDHRGGVGYYDSGHQLEGHVWPEASCAPCSLRAICPGLEASYHRMLGDTALVTQHDDPLAILAAAITDRGGDPATAVERLAALQREPRPSIAIIHRPEQNLVRFRHRDEPQPLELMLAERVANERAYYETARFALSYRPWDGVEEQARRPHVAAIMEAACAALEAADAAGLTVEEAVAAVSQSQVDGWTLEESQVATRPASGSNPSTPLKAPPPSTMSTVPPPAPVLKAPPLG